MSNCFARFVFAHPELEWDYNWLSKNQNITLSDVLAHPEIKWNYDNLSLNK